MPSWDPEVAEAVCGAIRDACPGVILNLTGSWRAVINWAEHEAAVRGLLV
jgi:uncharacterized protein (DUF849 family)